MLHLTCIELKVKRNRDMQQIVLCKPIGKSDKNFVALYTVCFRDKYFLREPLFL